MNASREKAIEQSEFNNRVAGLFRFQGLASKQRCKHLYFRFKKIANYWALLQEYRRIPFRVTTLFISAL